MPAPDSRPLTAPALRLALIAGARRVIAGRDALNRINVFPVADGDTGNNLASTLGSVLHGALSQPSQHVGDLLSRVGNDAIDGARGNSGAILAQFLHGVAERVRNLPELDARSLAAAVRQGAQSARQALAQPVEGTILSVIAAFAEELDAAAGEGNQSDARSGFVRALVRARRALADTPRQMALLQRAGVVDAGAQGFVDLLEGIAEFVEGGPRAVRVRASAPGAANDAAGSMVHDHAIDPARRWCTECLLLGEALDRDRLRAALEAGGADSIVIAGGASRLRVHAHIGSPQVLFDACAAQGHVEGMKADDMVRQNAVAAATQSLVVVTDSAADLPEDIAERHAIGVVPARVDLDGRDYLDKVGLSTGEFYRRMAFSRQLPRTSQPPPGDFRRQFELSLAHHARVLYVGLSRALSGTLQSGERAAARDPSGRVRVFDTVNAACGQALLVWRAAELAAEGRSEADVVAELERLRPLTRMWAIAPDISHAVRGGRIPRWAAPIAKLSALTPIAKMSAEGRMTVAGILLTRERAPEAFARRVARQLESGQRWRVIVGHCDARPQGERLLAALRARLRISEDRLVETGAAIGAHAGQGALIVAVQPAPDA
ncbi:MAG TPA: DegV family protein [Pseudoxanthomonas sp.]|nr:DegV family protein [Pseudoxanthomonas sp.]